MSDTGTCRVMRFWHDLLDSFDSDGGKILLLMVLMFSGFVSVKFGVAEGRDIIVGAFGALLIALKDSGSNKDRREGEPMPLPTNAGAAPVAPAPVQAAAVAPIVAAVEHVASAIKDEES